jgi:hypothetical protein
MKRIGTPLILLLLLVSSVNAQGQESPKGNLHRDFPNAQLIIPSIPPWHFNFDSNRWEQGYELTPSGKKILAAFRSTIQDQLRLFSKHKAKRLQKRTPHHMHREQPRQ